MTTAENKKINKYATITHRFKEKQKCVSIYFYTIDQMTTAENKKINKYATITHRLKEK